MNNNTLRKRLKAARRAIPGALRRQAQAAALARLRTLPVYRRARRIAAFVGTHGELDPMPLLHEAAAAGKQCYLPVLHPFRHGQLLFAPWSAATPMTANRFGIEEPGPRRGRLVAANRFDLVIVPMLAFNASLFRLGMGGGYYDRTFAFLHTRCHWRRETMLGLAFECQREAAIHVAPWDLQLDYVVTEQTLYRRHRADTDSPPPMR